MKKILLLIFCIGLAECVISQETKKQFIHQGILRATSTISPGYMLKENVSTISLLGNLEYYAAHNVSVRGDSYYFLGNLSKWPHTPSYTIDFNHATFFGASYHAKTTNNFDPYFGIQPGISFTQSIAIVPLPSVGYGFISGSESIERAANPLLSSIIGFNYYFERWFHLFGEARYIAGLHLSDASNTISLSEIRFSFGLGFNLDVFKPKSRS